jgi:hypothetical protein
MPNLFANGGAQQRDRNLRALTWSSFHASHQAIMKERTGVEGVRREAATAPPAPEFDAFLLAPMGEDRTGAPLNVLSALARLDIDPWEEAARLSQLPLEAAAQKLAALIAALPAGSSARAEPETTAQGLVKLLRSRPATPAHSSEPPAHSPEPTPRGVLIRSRILTVGLCYLVAMAIMMTSQWIAARHRQAQTEASLAPVSVTVFRETEPPLD